MISATELRIGNLINHTNENGKFELEVIELLKEGINVNSNDGIWFLKYEYIKPIPLTEEWLEKFGYNKFNYNSDTMNSSEYFIATLNKFKTKNGIVLKHGLKYSKNKVFGINYKCLSENPIEFVHQLQNIYFVLTGEELILKEN